MVNAIVAAKAKRFTKYLLGDQNKVFADPCLATWRRRRRPNHTRFNLICQSRLRSHRGLTQIYFPFRGSMLQHAVD